MAEHINQLGQPIGFPLPEIVRMTASAADLLAI
jgi:hypothetical protein